MPDPLLPPAEAIHFLPWFFGVASAALSAVTTAVVKVNADRIATLERIIALIQADRDTCREELAELRAIVDRRLHPHPQRPKGES